jgi:cysteine dioxygenase
LSTQIESPSNLTVGVCRDVVSLSLSDLVAQLNKQATPPSLAQLYEWLENARISDDELNPYLGFKDRTYWRHRVCRNDAVEMLVLCWKPGQRTVIHDHNGSVGAVLVQQGIVWESNFSFNETDGLRYENGREYAKGQITGADVPDIHQLGNPDISAQDLVTIHIYSPPLNVLHTYKPGSAVIDLYTPAEPD